MPAQRSFASRCGSARSRHCALKRIDLIRCLDANGCALLYEGGSHSVYVNRTTRKATTVPRHREINEHLARKIGRDVEIPTP